MNNDNKIRNFYEEEAEYEKSILIIKEIILKILEMKQELLKEKINYVDNESKYEEFIDLFNAVIGKKTNKYYLCTKEEDVKYYDLELGKVYRIDKLNPEIQAENSDEKQLKLQTRVILAEELINMTKELKQLFLQNVGKSDGSLATIDSHIIKEQDVDYLENLIKYLEILMDKTGRLKILDAERDVYSLERAQQAYNKKSSIEKWFYKVLNKENSVINNMAKKNK